MPRKSLAKLCWVAILFMPMASVAFADNKASSTNSTTSQPDVPEFAAGWRVTGVVRQGNHLEASMEHNSRSARFVREGQEVMPSVFVERIDPAVRSVTLRYNQQYAVIHTAPAPTVLAGKPGARPAVPPPPPQPSPWAGGVPPAAGQNNDGQWGIRFGNGGFFGAQEYASRFGSIDQAIEHAQERLNTETDPYRRAFHEQMLAALNNARGTGVTQPSAPVANAVPAHTTSSGEMVEAPQTTPAPTGQQPGTSRIAPTR